MSVFPHPKFFRLLCITVALTPLVSTAQGFVRDDQVLAAPEHVSAMAAIVSGKEGAVSLLALGRGRLKDPVDDEPAGRTVSLYVKTENGFELAEEFESGFGPYALAAGDLDADGVPDVAIANFMAARDRDVTLRFFGRLPAADGEEAQPDLLHLTLPDDEFDYTKMRDADHRPIFTAPGLTSLLIRDFNRDGHMDLAATGWTSDVLAIYLGRGGGEFEDARLIPAEGGPRSIDAADLDGDGLQDLAIAMYSSNEITLWKGEADGGFKEVERFRTRSPLPQHLRLADMNRDGRRDIVVSFAHAADSIEVHYADAPFQARLSQEILLDDVRAALTDGIRDLLVADLNGDGRPDIAVAAFAGDRVVVFNNESRDERVPQRFSRETYRFRDGGPAALCLVHANGDSKPDIAVALNKKRSISFLVAR